MSVSAQPVDDIRVAIRAAVERLEHVLPGQAPIQGFVHHNTLHGYQHLPFQEALAEARRITGARGYLPLARYRALHREGRITRDDLLSVLDDEQQLQSGQVLWQGADGPVTRRDVYLLALLYPLHGITSSQLNWQIEELGVLGRFQDDVPAETRDRLSKTAGVEPPDAVADLWRACLQVLDLQHFVRHPEELLDLAPARAEAMFSQLSTEIADGATDGLARRHLHRVAERDMQALLARVGGELTLGGLLFRLSGHDLLADVRPYLLRHLGNFLDLGTAAWHAGQRAQGFYQAWRDDRGDLPTWILEDLYDWHSHLDELPADPLDAIVVELERLDLPQARWIGYLERLALELPGWSGMFLWRHLHPGHQGQAQPVEMIDYLAVRLALERLFARRLCAKTWGIEPRLDMLRWQFRHAPAEFLVRHRLFDGRLPEYLATHAQRLVGQSMHRRGDPSADQWYRLAQLILTWEHSQVADRPHRGVAENAWPLFRLAQHLGLSGDALRALDGAQVAALFDCLERLDEQAMGFIWLRAHEHHYRDRIFNALVNNQGRGRWQARTERPSAQLVFCMDDREEGTRRHLEERDPTVETLGAAAHFGVPSYWRGLDDTHATASTPVVIVPANEVRERPRADSAGQYEAHRRRHGVRVWLRDALHHEIRRNLLSSTLGIALAAPAAAAALAGKVFAPRAFGQWAQRLQRRVDLKVPTEVEITAAAYDGVPGPANVQAGFVTEEQVSRVEHFLRGIGLTDGLAPLVVIMGHGSDSDNNPHLSAYNCGACSGNHSGPNARIFAAMANRPAVRALLRARQVVIPDDCWFVAAEHNTCSETITWYDADLIPDALLGAFERLDRTLQQVGRQHAHERCRKFASAPVDPSPEQALEHVVERTLDFSQARPELGHATNACALIGRRAFSQGLFLDRRAFLISYDPTRDPDGSVLESVLLANAPVGAGINLEYYFSTVDNEHYGAGSKVTHNLAGFFGVMDGAASDLRTGLPEQMIEIHEPIRLLVVVEAQTEVLSAIYGRQPALQELIGNGWLLLAAKAPDSAAIHLFEPAGGWKPWQGPVVALPTVARSSDYYPGTLAPLDPVLVAQAGESDAG